MIEKRGDEFVLLDSSGKQVLGKHPTKARAIAQEIAIKIAKKRRTRRSAKERFVASRS